MPLLWLLLPLAAAGIYFALVPGESLASVSPGAGAGDELVPAELLDWGILPYVADTPADIVGETVSASNPVSSSTGSSQSKAIARGLRNNNPGNIRATPTNWRGEVGTDGAFEIFATPEAGIRAIGVTLKNYQAKYGINTIAAAIARWAPAVENNTEAYINAVARALGVSPKAAIDFNNPATLATVTAAIIQHENGQQPFSMATILQSVSA